MRGNLYAWTCECPELRADDKTRGVRRGLRSLGGRGSAHAPAQSSGDPPMAMAHEHHSCRAQHCSRPYSAPGDRGRYGRDCRATGLGIAPCDWAASNLADGLRCRVLIGSRHLPAACAVSRGTGSLALAPYASCRHRCRRHHGFSVSSGRNLPLHAAQVRVHQRPWGLPVGGALIRTASERRLDVRSRQPPSSPGR